MLKVAFWGQISLFPKPFPFLDLFFRCSHRKAFWSNISAKSKSRPPPITLPSEGALSPSRGGGPADPPTIAQVQNKGRRGAAPEGCAFMSIMRALCTYKGKAQNTEFSSPGLFQFFPFLCCQAISQGIMCRIWAWGEGGLLIEQSFEQSIEQIPKT